MRVIILKGGRFLVPSTRAMAYILRHDRAEAHSVAQIKEVLKCQVDKSNIYKEQLTQLNREEWKVERYCPKFDRVDILHRPCPVFFILLLLLLVDNVVEDSKDHEHNPLSVAVEGIIFKADKMIVRHTAKDNSF